MGKYMKIGWRPLKATTFSAFTVAFATTSTSY
jgi:hypothetical protein